MLVRSAILTLNPYVTTICVHPLVFPSVRNENGSQIACKSWLTIFFKHITALSGRRPILKLIFAILGTAIIAILQLFHEHEEEHEETLSTIVATVTTSTPN